jgi:hypothetical protein
MFEVEIGAPKDWSIAHCNEIEQMLRDSIAQNVRGTKRVTIRFTTKDVPAFSDEFVARSDDPELQEDHDHDHSGHEDHAPNGDAKRK